MEWREFTAKTVDEALTSALMELGVTSDKIEYEIIEKESSKLLGLLNKPALIRVRLRMSYEECAIDFLDKVFQAMNMEVTIDASYDEKEKLLSIDLSGDEMGILIGKRGNTLDSLQYLVSLVVNANSESYVRVKLDTENYRERRKETLENLAKNLANKVKRTHKPLFLEPMNPFERRIIHSALQKDKFVETHSEGEDPYRKVVITLKPGVDTGYERRGKNSKGRSYNKNRGGNRKSGRENASRKKYDDEAEENTLDANTETVVENIAEE